MVGIYFKGDKMNSILPEYLKNVAYDVKQKAEKVSFNVKCSCGCCEFDFFKKKVTTEERKRKKWADELCKIYNGDFYHDKDGNFWMCSKSFLGIGKKKIKLTKQQYNDFMAETRDIVKVRCVNCGKEYILFDSSEYGYDGVVDFLENPLVADRSKIDYKNVISSAECAIEIRNTCPYSEFEEGFGKDGNYAMYTNAYSDIKIMAITAEKKKTIFSAETQ